MKVTYDCGKRWEELDGVSNTKRRCAECNESVFNLSGMTREQAESFMSHYRGETVCVRVVWREGRVVHTDDPIPQLHAQRIGARRLLAVGLAAQAVLAGFAAYADDTSNFYVLDPLAAPGLGLLWNTSPDFEPDEPIDYTTGNMIF